MKMYLQTSKILIEFKQSLLLLILIVSSYSVSAQEWQWANGFGHPAGNSVVNGLAKLGNDEIVATGYFEAPFIQIGNDVLEGNKKSFFISVLDKNGVYKKSITIDANATGVAIATDKNDNIYVAGNFFSLKLIAGSHTLTNKGGSDGFVLKLNKNLDIIWAMPIASPNEEELNDIKVDGDGDIYVSGFTAIFSSSPSTFNVFLIKISPDKTILRINQGSSTGYTDSKSISIDSDNNCYWAGNGTKLQFTHGFYLDENPYGSGFIIKFDPDGEVISNKVLPSVLTARINQQYLYVAQYYNDTNDFQNTGIRIVKYNLSLDSLWKTDIKRTSIDYSKTGIDHKVNLSVDDEENIYLYGTLHSDTLVFGSDTILGNLSSIYANIYLFKYDKNGKKVWVKSFGTNFENTGNAILAYGNDELVIAGTYQSDTINFGQYPLYNNGQTYFYYIVHWFGVAYKYTSAFIARLDNIITSIKSDKTFQTQLYPNPSKNDIIIQSSEFLDQPVQLKIYSTDGKLMQSNQLRPLQNQLKVNINGLLNGIYIITIQQNDQINAMRFIKN